MWFEDLTPYTYGPPDWGGQQTVNVGWLGDRADFPVAPPFEPFLGKLATLCRAPINEMRGFHVCGLCGFGDGSTGNGEIRVEGDEDTIYAAPVMIEHYVRAHHYAPPAAFRQAVMRCCRLCGGYLKGRIEGRSQGPYCPACQDWDCITTYFTPIVKDQTFYVVTVQAGDARDIAHIRAVAAITSEGYLRAKVRLAARPVLRFEAKALDLIPRLAPLERGALAYEIEPHFPYTQADAEAADVRNAHDSFHVIEGKDVAAPSVPTRPDLRDRLATPETYSGLPTKARGDRALLVVRRPALALASAYALFVEGHLWTLPRVQVDHDPAALDSAQASFGADAAIEASTARRLIERVRRMRPLECGPPFEGLDGPARFEIDVDGRISSFIEGPKFAAEVAMVDELTVELDRLLPASNLRLRAASRRGRRRVDEA